MISDEIRITRLLERRTGDPEDTDLAWVVEAVIALRAEVARLTAQVQEREAQVAALVAELQHAKDCSVCRHKGTERCENFHPLRALTPAVARAAERQRAIEKWIRSHGD